MIWTRSLMRRLNIWGNWNRDARDVKRDLLSSDTQRHWPRSSLVGDITFHVSRLTLLKSTTMSKKKKKKDAGPRTGPRTIATNRKARHEYFIEESFDAGIALTGTEIKSVRLGQVSLQDGFVLIRDGEAWLMNVHIAQYALGNRYNHEETRRRKLLLHRREISRLHGQATQRNWTIVPLKMYINEKGLAKVQIGLARGKQQHDKRASIAKRDSDREIRRVLKETYR